MGSLTTRKSYGLKGYMPLTNRIFVKDMPLTNRIFVKDMLWSHVSGDEWGLEAAASSLPARYSVRYMKKTKTNLIPQESIESKIFSIRGKRVLLDRDLAVLYGVETRVLNQAVKRNITRFPEDFMFQLTKEETENWKSQIVISNREKMGLRRRPYAFTEQGVAMLSSVLNSERAIQVNIQIMRAFIKLKEMLSTHKDLKQKIEEMEKKYDYQFKIVFDAIKQLLEPPVKQKSKIGFQKP